VWVCVGGNLTGPYLADSDQTDPAHGIVCTQAGDLESNLRELYYLSRALKWLLAL
jgi:hypothetical protein